MRRTLTQPRVWIVAVLSLVCVALIFMLVVRAQAKNDRHAITVMTRNLYIGADIARPLRAAEGHSGQDAVLALGHANHELRKIVDRTNFGTRSDLLAEEITKAQPDLLALQEVALWRRGPLQLDQLGQLNATQVDYDFLAMLVADLDQRGARYQLVYVQEESDVEAPGFTGNPYEGTAQDSQDIRLTVRDAILVRQASGIQVTDSGGAHYRHVLPVDLGGVQFRFVRGYAWTDVLIGQSRLRFVSTHLESQNDDVAAAQADELLTALAGLTTLTTIIACDCNADPAKRDASRDQMTVPLTTYEVLTRTDRFADLWLQQQPESASPGFTAGLSELVNDPTAARFARRLDLVLARPARSTRVTVSHAEITGNDLSDHDASTGLWPSDHAGVLLRLGLS